VRGRAAAPIGELNSLLVLIKGLPLAYDRDLQEDKAFVFRSVERARGCLRGMTAMIAGLDFDEARLEEAASFEGSWATDTAELLVTRGLPFRSAHEVTGRLVTIVEQAGGRLTEDLLETHHELLEGSDLDGLSPRRSLERRRSHGGPAPERVAEQVERLLEAVRALGGG